MAKKKYEWKECYKIDSGTYAEVFKDFVRIMGNNYDSIEAIDRAIKMQEDELELFKEVKRVWLEKFINKQK